MWPRRLESKPRSGVREWNASTRAADKTYAVSTSVTRDQRSRDLRSLVKIETLAAVVNIFMS